MTAYSDLLLILKSLEELAFGDPLSSDVPTLIAICRRHLRDDPASTDARRLLHLLEPMPKRGRTGRPAPGRELDRRGDGHAP